MMERWAGEKDTFTMELIELFEYVRERLTSFVLSFDGNKIE